MNRFSIALNVLLSAAIVLILINTQNSTFKKNKDDLPKEPNHTVTCKTECMSFPSDDDLIGSIPTSLAQTLSRNYAADKGKSYVWKNGEMTDSADATSIWFSLKALEQFVGLIEKWKCKKNCGDSLGVRIYYCRYPDADSRDFTAGMNKEFANRHSLFMVPTYYDSTKNRHFDFNLFDDCHAPFKSSGGDQWKRNFIFSGFGEGQNHGDLTPPPGAVGSGTFPTSPEN